MNLITLLSAQPWVERLGWTILHFLWQGGLIAALYAAVRRGLRPAGAKARYALACLALLGMAAAPVVTWCVIGNSGPSPAPSVLAALTRVPVSGAPAAPSAVMRAVSYPAVPEPFCSWVVALWIAGSIAFWMRLAGAWAFAVRLRCAHVRPAPPEWQRTLERLRQRIRGPIPVRLLVSSLASGPVVVGWLRPVVLVPLSVLTGLPPEQMEVLLLHELAHIRRRDYLVNILQSIVEAVLFYHPAVWWISAHIREERELCCDDLAVSITGDPVTFAHALAQLAAIRPAPLEATLAAAGRPLAQRIARLLGHPRVESRQVAGPEILAGAVLLATAAVALFAQPAVRPKFEVASVKPSQEQRFMMVRPLPGGRLTATAPLRLLMQNAYGRYGMQSYQIVGGPAWIDSERWEIEAKAEGNATRADVLEMLQTLLEDRFQLKTHHETRVLPVYKLVPAKNGPKLPLPNPGSCVDANPDMPPPPSGRAGIPCGRVGVMGIPNGARIMGGKVLMPEFTRILSMVLGRTVIDQSGVTHPFDVKLDFAPDAGTAGLPLPMGPTGPVPPSSSDAVNPPIFTAIQEQLGLKLESAKGPVDVLVIDHVERPSAN